MKFEIRQHYQTVRCFLADNTNYCYTLDVSVVGYTLCLFAYGANVVKMEFQRQKVQELLDYVAFNKYVLGIKDYIFLGTKDLREIRLRFTLKFLMYF